MRDLVDGDSVLRKKTNDRLRDGATVTVNTTGPCTGIKLRYTPGNPALVDKSLAGGPTVWTTTLLKNTDQWYGLGGQELRVVQGSRTVVWLYSVFTLVAG